MEYGTLADLQAVSSPSPGTIAVVYADGSLTGHNGVYFRTNTAWVHIAEQFPPIIPSARLPQASGSQAGIINSAEYAKISTAIDGATLHNTPAISNSVLESGDAILLDDASVTVGSQLREITISELDKRWGTTTSDSSGAIALDRLPSNTQIVSRAVVAGGNRPWPDDNVQVAGPVQSTAYTSVPGSASWGKSAGRVPGGFAIQPGNFLMRFAKAVYATQPVISGAVNDVPNLRIATGEDVESIVIWTPVLTALASDSEYWYANAAITRLPADENSARLEINEPTEFDLALTDGSVVPADLKYAAGTNIAGRTLTIEEGVFSTQIITDSRQLINAPLTPGINATADRDSAIARANLTERLNVQAEPHGIIAGAWTVNLSNKSAASTHFHDGSDSFTVSFTTTIEAIARSAEWNASNQLGHILATTDIVTGSTELGSVVLRAAHDNGGDVGLNWQYQDTPGHSITDTFSIGSRLETGCHWLRRAARACRRQLVPVQPPSRPPLILRTAT